MARRSPRPAAQDKATMEMESMEEGYLAKILVAEGTEGIPVGKPVAVMCDSAADSSSTSPRSLRGMIRTLQSGRGYG